MTRILSLSPAAKWTFVACCIAATCGLFAATRGAPVADDPQAWARAAVGDDRVAAERAIQSLRDLGPAGLRAFFEVHGDALAQIRSQSTPSRGCDAVQRRLTDAVDAIAGQRDAAWSGLYWYTDLAAAREAARKKNKPILSLRLLGKLTDELSCANSRFFRTTLYADPNVSRYLHHNFILHWKTYRPVPKITVDFGDGRRLERTITGNSVHYVLDSNGRVIDALPGLYTADAFVKYLHSAFRIADQSGFCDDEASTRLSLAFHQHNKNWLTRVVADPKHPTDLSRVEIASPVPTSAGTPGMSQPGVFSTDLDVPFTKSSFEQPLIKATEPSPVPNSAATSDLNEEKETTTRSGTTVLLPTFAFKTVTESKLIDAVEPTPVPNTAATADRPTVGMSAPGVFSTDLDIPFNNASFGKTTSEIDAIVAVEPTPVANSAATADRTFDLELLSKLAERDPCRLHPQSERLIRAKFASLPDEFLPGPRAEVENKMLARFKRAIELETARNEFFFHRTIHGWLADDPDVDLEKLNDRVYAELFQMPRGDLWHGLLNTDAFSALDGHGVVVEAP